LSGRVTDSSGAVLPDVEITLISDATARLRTVKTEADGSYRIPLLEPGLYHLEAKRAGFKVVAKPGVTIIVTETSTLNFAMELGSVTERVIVTSQEAFVQTESSDLGRVVGPTEIVALPLVTRNFTQIVGLSPGVVTPVANATDLGAGGPGSTFGEGEGMYSQGQRSFDNNFQIDGIQVNDTLTASASAVPTPSPDTIQEFKVLTGQYDAAFGRNAGANVNVVTKGGTNDFHGDAYEFFRNRVLNANDFFFNRNEQERPTLSSNQFGGTLGGPILKDKLFFFGAFELTRQNNAFANGCSATVFLPAFTNDRSAGAIGSLFAGQRGLFQNVLGGVGPAIAADGSNINPIALRYLQAKAPDGNFLIPTPQTVDPSRGIDTAGSSTYSIPCKYSANQYLANVDYLLTKKQHLTGHVFGTWGSSNAPFFGSGSSVPTNVPGTSAINEGHYILAQLSHTYVFGSNLFNHLQISWWRSIGRGASTDGLPNWSSFGVTVPPVDDEIPALFVSNMFLGSGGVSTQVISHAILQDTVGWVRGRHSFRFGGGLDRQRFDNSNFTFPSVVDFATWADFLLGLDATQNGTFGLFSNVLGTFDFLGQFGRDWHIWDGSLFAQDDFKVTRRLTLNLGVRYERIGQFADALGRNSSFDRLRADPSPPASGSFAGYVVAANYKGGPLPPGVTKLDNNFAIEGLGENRVSPRIGLAWQLLPHSNRFVIRSGWGMYNSRPAGSAAFQQVTGPPYSLLRSCFVTCNPAATLENPFPPGTPAPSDFPIFPAYSPTTALTINTVSQKYQPGIVQHYSLGVQTQLANDLLLEIGYVGARGTRLTSGIEANQALDASPANPIPDRVNGGFITSNTVANVNLRRPLLGWARIIEAQSNGSSKFNALEASLNKRMSHGLQFLASYTWSRAFDTSGASLEDSGFGVGAVPGNQDDPRARWGPSAFNHEHRFILSYIYELPSPKNKAGVLGGALSGWSISGVTTLQTGKPLTLVGVNSNNVFGINTFGVLDHINYAPGCTASGLRSHGSIGDRLNAYFNGDCIDRTDLSKPFDATNNPAAWPVISPDGIGTGFGNVSTGVVKGPGQANFDFAIMKRIPIKERFNAEFRTEFFNVFNHPQFRDPDTNVSDSTFGVISATSVNARVIQFALKLHF
jgi:hypothetical protein